MISHLLSAALLLAASNPQAQQFLATAEQQAHIFADHGSPIQLEVDFTAQMPASTRGHLSLRWQSRNLWWSKTVLGDFQQTTVQIGERVYTAQNRPAPIRIRELTRLLHFAHAPEEVGVTSSKQHAENGVVLTCLQIEWQKVKSESHEVCVNPLSHEIVSDTWQGPPNSQNRELFSSYADFSGHRYPRKLQLQLNGTTIITATVQGLSSAPIDQKLFVPPSGSVERRQCAGIKHAVPLKTPNPPYAKFAGQKGLSDDTLVAMTVLTDGSVRDIEAIGADASPLDDVTLATLKTWKFKPAMCGAEPVVSDIQVVVSLKPKQ
jgi:hypothetical protein